MKKVKGRCFSYDPPLEDPRMAFKHQRLLTKIQELSQDIDTKKKRLETLKQRKSTLSTEVIFLKRRFRDLTTGKKKANPIPCSWRKKLLIGEDESKQRIPSTSESIDRELPMKRRKEPIFDLNETWSEEKEGDEYAKEEDEPMVKQQLSEMKSSGCRNGPRTMGKRKISWQDPVALRV